MSKINDGGPAFPVQYSNEADGPTIMPTLGLSLRDYFAAKAMQGLLTNLPKSMHGFDWMRNTSVASYELADAMLRARGQQ